LLEKPETAVRILSERLDGFASLAMTGLLSLADASTLVYHKYLIVRRKTDKE